MESHGQVHGQRRCFCEIDFELIEHLAKRRYVEDISSLELLQEAGTSRERDAIMAVAMLHLPWPHLKSICEILKLDVAHVFFCRATTVRKLLQCGIRVPTRPLNCSTEKPGPPEI
jgi:hypothetical protein